MAEYGFDDDDFDPPVLKRTSVHVPKSKVVSAAEAGRELGFAARSTDVVDSGVIKDRRQINREPQGRLLLTGPSRVLDRLRDMSIESNQPYWRVIESLLDKHS